MEGLKYTREAGFTPLYVIAGTGHIIHFLKHWRTPTDRAGKILRCVTAWSQYQAGTSTSILDNVTTDLSYIEGKFVLAVRVALDTIKGKINIKPNFVIQPLHQGNKCIMDLPLLQTMSKIGEKESVLLPSISRSHLPQ